MKVFSKTYDFVDMCVESCQFNEVEVSKHCAAKASKDELCHFIVKDFRYIRKGDEIQVVLYDTIRPARTS